MGFEARRILNDRNWTDDGCRRFFPRFGRSCLLPQSERDD